MFGVGGNGNASSFSSLLSTFTALLSFKLRDFDINDVMNADFLVSLIWYFGDVVSPYLSVLWR